MPEPEGTVGEVLERDHHRIDEQLASFGRSLAADAVDAAAFTAANQGLRHHIYVEEELHFPALREAGLLAPVLVMLREHGEIWDTLDRIDAGISAGAPGVDLMADWERLEQQLAEHNMKEERILYPAGDQVLPPDVAEEAISVLASGATPEGWVCEQAGRS